MQETALDASAAAGYDLARYQAMGCYWLVRQTTIDYLLPLSYGDSVEVKTWVIGFGRVRSRRAYEFRRVADGKPVAQAETDWVYFDMAAGRPTATPPELKAAFFPEGLPEAFCRPRSSRCYHHPAGLVYNPAAGRLARYRPGTAREQCRVPGLHGGWRDRGRGGSRLAASRLFGEGIAIVARQHRIEYRQPAVFDDELEIAHLAFEPDHQHLSPPLPGYRVADRPC